MNRRHAFTLIELLIVVAIIGILAAIAVPSFMRARQRTYITRYVSGLRIVTDAFSMYAAEHGSYPADCQPAVLPAGMALYLGKNFDFTAPTPIGGNWDWDYKVYGFTGGVSVVASTFSAADMLDIDTRIDDGVLSTGSFRVGSGRYTSIIEF